MQQELQRLWRKCKCAVKEKDDKYFSTCSAKIKPTTWIKCTFQVALQHPICSLQLTEHGWIFIKYLPTIQLNVILWEFKYLKHMMIKNKLGETNIKTNLKNSCRLNWSRDTLNDMPNQYIWVLPKMICGSIKLLLTELLALLYCI